MDTLQENFIDVTLIDPNLKHSNIFEVFDGLNCCESLTVRNNRDPKPIYYQLLEEKGDTFTWQYLKKGPEWWNVLITKIHQSEQETIGEIAVKDLRKVAIFKKYGIDFCCGGKKTIREVCVEKNIDATKLETELQQIDAEPKVGNMAYNNWNIDFLTDYIVNNHHSYVRKHSPELLGYAIKVAQVHGKHHPELLLIKDLVVEITEALAEHMTEEETLLFTYVKEIVFAKSNKKPIDQTGENLENWVADLETEHDFVGRCFEQINVLSKGYALPEDACATYKLFFKALQIFEDDLHIHIHLENNILFPKAIAMEKSLTA